MQRASAPSLFGNPIQLWALLSTKERPNSFSTVNKPATALAVS